MKFVKLFFIALFFLGSCSEKSPELKEVKASELDDLISSFKGEKAVLVNVWATWCGPCVEEFPDIVKVRNKYQDEMEVVFISADFPEQVPDAIKFLKEQGVDWDTYLKNDSDELFINSLDQSWTGALPFTVIFTKSGKKLTSWEDKASFDIFEQQIQKAIQL